MFTYDLHLHTTASDGSYTPQELCALAKGRGLQGIAITDHDTIRAYGEIQDDLGLTLIPGVEINTEYAGQEVHILGYGMDLSSSQLTERLLRLQSLRAERARKIVEKLNQIGLRVTWDSVLEITGAGVIGRPHVGMALVQAGYAVSVRDAMQKYIGKDKPAYVPRYDLTPQEAVTTIREAGGIAVLAHPGLIKAADVVRQVVAAGVDGLEAYYPQHSREQEEEFLQLAERFQLVVTGGSDFHGLSKGENADRIGLKGLDQKNFDIFLARIKGIPTRT
jgi:predicted metal-dependent phosphoesterase TrpH